MSTNPKLNLQKVRGSSDFRLSIGGLTFQMTHEEAAHIHHQYREATANCGLPKRIAERLRALARKKVDAREGEREVDDGAPLSFAGEPGAYVQMWVWVDFEEAGIRSRRHIATAA